MRGGTWIVLGGILGFLGVGLGAFGAHGLEGRLDAERLAWWHTAAHYQLIHAGALVLVGILADRGRASRVAGVAFLVGVVVFCGTLYALALGAPRGLGAFTPLGGFGLLLGWLGMAWSGRRPAAGPSSA